MNSDDSRLSARPRQAQTHTAIRAMAAAGARVLPQSLKGFLRRLAGPREKTYAIHTVFIARENILFMEEWIDYHIQLGFNKFYLYDNSKCERAGEWDRLHSALAGTIVPGAVNKYGINYRELVGMTDEEVAQMLQALAEKYRGMIVFAEWSPRDEEGVVTYGQEQAFAHALARMKADGVDWCAFIDMDQFIVIGGGEAPAKPIDERLAALPAGVGNIEMREFRLPNRFHQIERLVIDADKGFAYPIQQSEFRTNICKPARTHRIIPHRWSGEGEQYEAGLEDICVNHYVIPPRNIAKRATLRIDNIHPALKERIRQRSCNYLRARRDGRPYAHCRDQG